MEVESEFMKPYHEEAMKIIMRDIAGERLSLSDIDRYHEIRWMYYLFKSPNREDSKEEQAKEEKRVFRKIDNSMWGSVPPRI